MAYLVLARKYRPQKFSDVVGQDHVTRTLLNALAQKRIAHGYIFSGHRGIGKTTIARILAMALNCRTVEGSAERPTPEPCGVCESCTEVRAGNSVDVIEIDAATNRGIDEIRELRDAARYRPARDRYKIWILDEAHQITDAAFNALLKTLEEPPDHVIFMMATTQPEDIPQTIRSRCQHFSFHAVSFEQIVAQLSGIAAQEGITLDDAALGLLAEAGDGSMRDALSIMDQAIASAPCDADGKAQLSSEQIRELIGTVPSNVFEQALEAVSANDGSALLLQLDTLLNAGHSPQQLARQMVRYLRNALMVKIAGDATELLQVSADERKRAARSAMLFSEEDLTRFLQIMLRTFDELGYRQEQRFHFELGMLKLVHAQRLLPLEQMLSAQAGKPASQQVSGPALPMARGHAQPQRPAAIPASLPKQETAPSFSPFERDTRRKEPVQSAESRPVATMAASTRTEGSLALAPEPLTETFVAPELAAEENWSADQARTVAANAVHAIGQSSAAQFLGDSLWSHNEREWKIEVAMNEKMLSISINLEARKIAEKALRDSGIVPARINLIATGASKPAAKAEYSARPSGDLHQLANKNELVQKAKELFQADIRDVVDLRGRRR